MSIDYNEMKFDELRKCAGAKAKADGFATTLIRTQWKKPRLVEYLNLPKGVDPYQTPAKIVEPVMPLPVAAVDTDVVKDSLPVKIVLPEPVKGTLPPAEPRKKQKDVLANGRNKKGMPSFDQWHCRIFPIDVTYPAWKYLTKTATDVANICKAKRDHSAAKNRKDSSGIPIFDFAFSEAVNFFRIPRPTFTSAIKLLLEVGFIEYSCPGGIRNGVGIKATYRLSDKWKYWEAPVRDNTNITAARKHLKRPVKTKSQ